MRVLTDRRSSAYRRLKPWGGGEEAWVELVMRQKPREDSLKEGGPSCWLNGSEVDLSLHLAKVKGTRGVFRLVKEMKYTRIFEIHG